MSEPKNIKQILLDCHVNVWAIDLFVESFLKNPKPTELEFFYPVNRKDCEQYDGAKIKITPIPKDS